MRLGVRVKVWVGMYKGTEKKGSQCVVLTKIVIPRCVRVCTCVCEMPTGYDMTPV